MALFDLGQEPRRSLLIGSHYGIGMSGGMARYVRQRAIQPIHDRDREYRFKILGIPVGRIGGLDPGVDCASPSIAAQFAARFEQRRNQPVRIRKLGIDQKGFH
jgi:hypothetical protein